jgi:hypothetical protein
MNYVLLDIFVDIFARLYLKDTALKTLNIIIIYQLYKLVSQMRQIIILTVFTVHE